MRKSDEEWNAENRAQEIEEVRAALKQTDVPDEFIKELSDNEQKVAAPVANLSTMRVEEFLDMYLASRGSKMIPDGDPLYPRRPIRKDGLLPAERFKVAEDVARTTGLVDQNGDVVPLPPERQGKSMLYLMLDWKHTPQQSAQSGTPQ